MLSATSEAHAEQKHRQDHDQKYAHQRNDELEVLIEAHFRERKAGDQDRAAEAFRDSSSAIDVEHKRVMKQVLAGTPHAELGYECMIGDALST